MLRPFSFCLLSSVLLILSHPPYNLWFLAWIALVPFFFVIEKKRFWPAFGWGYLFGLFYFFGMFWWFIHVTLPGMILLNMFLALYFALFGATCTLIPKKPLTLNAFLVACAWVAWEFARAHFLSGFGWAALGHTQYQQAFIIQIADITGVFGVSFFLVIINQYVKKVTETFFDSDTDKKGVRHLYGFSVAVMLMFITVVFYGVWRSGASLQGAGVSVAVVQPNIAQKDKWDVFQHERIFEQLSVLTREAAKGHPDIILWPEAALPPFPDARDRAIEKVKEIARDIQTPIVLGYVREKGGKYYNSAGLVSAKGELVSEYDKLHLVPFGEFVPLRKIFPFLTHIVPIGDISPGQGPKVFALEKKGLTNFFGALICFEDTVGNVPRLQVRAGAEFLTNLTNDAWFGRTKAPWLHLQSSVLEAVSYHRGIVRCANTGVSAFINASGKIYRVLRSKDGEALFRAGISQAEVKVRGDKTFYLLAGDIFAYLCIACLCANVIISNISIKIQTWKQEELV